jgi:uncharacterized RDD family membrane protein YckC
LKTRTNTLDVRTPEGIVFSQYLAGPFSRCLAWGIDLAALIVVTWLLSLALAPFSLISPGLAQALNILLFFLLSIGYSMVLEWIWHGQTLGKRVMRLRVVDAHGLRLQISQIIVRNVLRLVDMLPAFYLVGGMVCLISPRAQRLGDIAANTAVIRLPRVTEPDLAPLRSDKYNSLRSYPHLEARLRQRVSPAEAALALHALARRDGLEPGDRLLLFRDIAHHFRAKVAFPPEAVRDLADEQYVHNVVDLLYRPRSSSSSKNPTRPSH